MNLTDVRDEITARLGTINGLRAYAWVKSPATPPAALVMLPTEIQYDQAYARGGDRISMDVVVVAGRSDERSAYNRISAYADGNGTSSVKATLDPTGYTTCDAVTVTQATFGVVTIEGVDYLAVTFTLDVVGQGS